MHVYIKLANFTAKPRFENLVACSRLSDSRVRRSVGSELNCTVHRENGSSLQSFFFPREFFSRVLLSERLEQAKNPAIGQALFRSARTFVNAVEFSFLNLSNVTFRSPKKLFWSD